LINNGVMLVAEISNMGCTPEAVEAFNKSRTLFAPGKAVNAGGVATSGLEMTQNAMKLRWNYQEVDSRLHEIMCNIHKQCCKHGKQEDGYIDYVKGANVAGFLKVANSMIDMGVL